MSEIKFACPHCDQHIACDESHGGRVIQCPACLGVMRIPQSLHAAAADALRLAARTPGVGRTRLYPTVATVDPWTEEEWNEHRVKHGAFNLFSFTGGTKLGVWFWFFFLAPLFLFFLSFAFKDLRAWSLFEATGNFVLNLLQLEHGTGPIDFWGTAFFVVFVTCALVSGFLLAGLCTSNPLRLAMCGVAFALPTLMLDLFVCFFGGCTLGCAQAAQEGVGKPRSEVRLDL
jgi:hypothetical protein